MELTERDDAIEIVTTRYRLRVERNRPRAHLADAAGTAWTTLSLLASVDRTDRPDETLAGVTLTRDDHRLIMELPSSAWDRKLVVLDCREERLELSVEVFGSGATADVTLAGGAGMLPSGACGTFRSSIEAPSLFVPTPTQPVAVVRPSSAAAVITVVGDAEPGRLNGIFSPGPLAFAVGRAHATSPTAVPDGDWLALWLRCAVEQATFTAFRYEPEDGGWLLRLPYQGHTEVDRHWTSPTLVIKPVEGAWDAVSEQRRDLVDHGLAPAAGPVRADWWERPIFCGWGAQCALAGQDSSGAAAPELARQAHYDRWLATLADAGLSPGTVVIDDKWQDAYGLGTVDTGKWPDLAGWIRARHEAGQRVLLWWKAWDPEGVPADECIRDPHGRPVAVNPAHPAYRERLTKIVTTLLDPDGLGADGFKIDFTQRSPSGASLTDSGSWGIALLHRLLAVITEAARSVRPDALLVTHTVHPWFGDVSSMIRLNDVLETDVDRAPVPVADQLRFRAAVARAALPEHPIDTDQWPMPSLAAWRSYVEAQAELGVPALYYVDRLDGPGEPLTADDHALVARSWAARS
jgi:hypothetical protein